MAERSPGSAVVRRRLGVALRRLREKGNIRIEAAARELECSPAKISRLENGQGPAKLWDVRILLSFYGVEDAATRQRFEDWARGTKAESWWESDADLTTDDLDRYFAAETEAARIRMFCTPVVPALLQTADYARAHTKRLFPDWPAEDVERFVAVRIARQDTLHRRIDPLVYETVIDEAALLRRVGTADVHMNQLLRLVALVEQFAAEGRRNLTVRILPLAAGPGRALSPFTIFDPRNVDLDPTTAYVEETPGAGSWVEPEMAQQLVEIYAEMLALSADPDESLSMLREITTSSRGATSNPTPSTNRDERPK